MLTNVLVSVFRTACGFANKLGLSATGALGKGRNKSLVFYWVRARRDEILYVWDLMVLGKHNFTRGCYFLVYLHTFGILEQALRVSNERTLMNRNNLVRFHLQEGTEHTS